MFDFQSLEPVLTLGKHQIIKFKFKEDPAAAASHIKYMYSYVKDGDYYLHLPTHTIPTNWPENRKTLPLRYVGDEYTARDVVQRKGIQSVEPKRTISLECPISEIIPWPGGKRETFGINVGKTPKLNLKRVEKVINQAHERLQGVIIEELDWLEVIRRYDRKETLFYIDPPYRLKSSKMYCGKMRDSDYTVLRLLLGSIKGKFILSINVAHTGTEKAL